MKHLTQASLSLFLLLLLAICPLVGCGDPQKPSGEGSTTTETTGGKKEGARAVKGTLFRKKKKEKYGRISVYLPPSQIVNFIKGCCERLDCIPNNGRLVDVERKAILLEVPRKDNFTEKDNEFETELVFFRSGAEPIDKDGNYAPEDEIRFEIAVFRERHQPIVYFYAYPEVLSVLQQQINSYNSRLREFIR